MIIEAVTDDMPFLVDSLTGELNRMDLTVHLVVHPTVHVRRDAKGTAEALGSDAPNARAESFIHAEIDEQADPDMIETIQAGIERVLADVRLAVTDWRAMCATAADILAKIDGVPLPKDEIGAVGAVLDDLVALQSEIARKVLAAVDAAASDKASAGLEAWLAPRRTAVERFEETLGEIRAANAVDLAMLTVATRELRALATF